MQPPDEPVLLKCNMVSLACILLIYHLIVSVTLGLISKNQPSGEKELGGLTLRDLWENSSNTANKPLAPIGGGLSVTRANAGKD